MKKLTKFKLEEFSAPTILSDREKRGILGGEEELKDTCADNKTQPNLCDGECKKSNRGNIDATYYCKKKPQDITGGCGCYNYS